MLTQMLLNGAYVHILYVFFSLLALVSICGVFFSCVGCWQRQSSKNKTIGLSALLLGWLLYGWIVWGRTPSPNVYYDEFYYTATAANLATNGVCEPLLWQGGSTVTVQPLGYFCPPYPQGWPFLLSLSLPPASAPVPGHLEASPWLQTLCVTRLLHVLMPLLLFLALQNRFRVGISVAMLGAWVSLPVVWRLSAGNSSETGALALLLLCYLALEELLTALRSGSRVWCLHLLWLALACGALSQMRPECLMPSLLLLACGFWQTVKRQAVGVSSLDRRTALLLLALAGLLWLGFFAPAAVVMLGHNPEQNHHFAALPREGMSMMQNRWANLGNNLLFFLNNSEWPVGLTLLALAGCGLVGWDYRRSRLFRQYWGITLVAGLWLIGITVFLSCFPFGDYICAHSIDAWRFSYHVLLPGVVLAAVGLTGLCQGSLFADNWSVGRVSLTVLVGLVFLQAGQAWVWPSAFLTTPHRFSRVWDYGRQVNLGLGEQYLLATTPEHYCMWRYGLGAPCILPPQGLELCQPLSTGAVSTRQDEVESLLKNQHSFSAADWSLYSDFFRRSYWGVQVLDNTCLMPEMQWSGFKAFRLNQDCSDFPALGCWQLQPLALPQNKGKQHE